ncbi:DUF1972 domain-containing protein [Periweissella fabaria]|uniref:DUF1972 domain-containing protein n=1 Tax=Periweissella fabaria TaxID=546157 RepID=A0ABM8Z5L2_9LACO|nr:DUF1972 domain-containing protein [Periweissella fabaria]MCM0596587.1 DUF1972 domain-containing protein [Periweissella fabaria]CAH0416488.1 hypothetical protein WFA24289_00792 [Periweissella fabaria]
MTKNVFIVGSRGIPAKYGGFETFAQELVENRESTEIKYFVASQRKNSTPIIEEPTFEYHGATVFQIDVGEFGPTTPIMYDIKSILWVIKYVKKHSIQGSIIYILGNTIGPLLQFFVPTFRKLDIQVFVNPDGLEWKRAKWIKPIRTYLKVAESSMVKTADLIVSDNPGIEDYLRKVYVDVDFTSKYIAYGVKKPKVGSDSLHRKRLDWLQLHNISENDYYLVVGRFIPENNYETILKEFIRSNTNKKLVIITRPEGKFFNDLKNKTDFERDPRIIFAGTVYDPELLSSIRTYAYAYIHGHSVGGTNPSLLEALSTTKLNLLYDVNFNHYVGQDSSLYWTLQDFSLAHLIETADKLNSDQINEYHHLAQKRVETEYDWKKISQQYETLFLER